MLRGLSACVFVLLSTAAIAAEESEQLDAEFLEYLAHLEGDDDDWTLVAQEEEADRKAEKPSKPADPPPVDER